MAGVQELCTTKGSAGCDNHYAQALSWTVRLLTEDNPCLMELWSFFPAMRDVITMRDSNENVIQHLFFDQEFALLGRITQLLSPPYRTLMSEQRNKHDILCIKAITYFFSIIRPTDTRCYLLILSLFKDFAWLFAERPATNVSDLTSVTHSGQKIIVAKLWEMTTAMMHDRTTNILYLNQVVVALLHFKHLLLNHHFQTDPQCFTRILFRSFVTYIFLNTLTNIPWQEHTLLTE